MMPTYYDRKAEMNDTLNPKPGLDEESTTRIGARRRFDFNFVDRDRRKTIDFILCIVSALVIAALLLSRRNVSLESCLASAEVAYVIRDSKDWAQKILPWNLRLNYTPSAVAIPRSIDQIQSAVSCGIQKKLRLSAKGGGHSFGSFGLGGENGHLVIELDRMDAVTLYDNHTAKVQPGARLGHVSVELYNQGRRAIPHGACPG